MKGIILASHGRLAEGMLDTLQIFSDGAKQIEALCLMPGDDVAEFLEKLKEAIDHVDTGDGAVIFCDLLFGSPCNCSARLLNDSQYADRITVITGMNLPMVMEYEGARAFGMESEEMMETGKSGIIDFGEMLKSNNP
ncbi:MAG: PTS sugar transporter subunit IIA [Lachnospiraceae bacterium]|nr:PTS sugar transporter subunit IIA [Lachnospiraceae bacterium]